jgi:hypothetical protein
MLTKVRLVLLALLLVGGYVATPQAANAATYLNNYKVRVTIGGVVATGGQINWTNFSLRGSSFVSISSTGYAVFPRIVREAGLTVQGVKVKGPVFTTTNSSASLDVIVGKVPVIDFIYRTIDSVEPEIFLAVMQDGTPIPGAVIEAGSCNNLEWTDSTDMFGPRWEGDYVNSCGTWGAKSVTDSNGMAKHYSLYGADGTDPTATFSDGLVDQVVSEWVSGWSTYVVPAIDAEGPKSLLEIASQYPPNGWGCKWWDLPEDQECDAAWVAAAILAKWDQIEPGVTHTEADVVAGASIPVRSGPPTFVFVQMPVIDIAAVATTVNYGAAKTITATARNANGSPIVGRSLTLSASTSGASASCSGRKTTATTNSSGRATFKVCPVKTATWSVDGRSIVGSAGVKLTVQLTPTAPRTLVGTPKNRSVSLSWVVPMKANASAVADYIVQYRLQGATTWITFRDGTSTARKATVTGLTSGQAYEFRVAAKSKAGTGTWSGTVLKTPQ